MPPWGRCSDVAFNGIGVEIAIRNQVINKQNSESSGTDHESYSGCLENMTGDQGHTLRISWINKGGYVAFEFKIVDENLVLLRAPRKNDVYSLNLKSIIPSGGVTCLVARASEDEAILWHRRLGHVNFKNINKLVKSNLVRGLPSKTFKHDYSCLACRKGKNIRLLARSLRRKQLENP
ncbi:ribonuclease H-like domain-containing protein [Tanacetum coccineum]